MERRLINEGIYKNLPQELQSITEVFEGRERDIGHANLADTES